MQETSDYSNDISLAQYDIRLAPHDIPASQVLFSCRRVTKGHRIEVKVSKSSVTALFDKLEFDYSFKHYEYRSFIALLLV